jgi:DNA-binding transcriptional regulator YdaS (Cro superfamily)
MQLIDYLARQGISQRAFAVLCGVSQRAVAQWLAGRIPAERVLQIEEVTSGVVCRYELRPDLYPVSEAPLDVRRRIRAQQRESNTSSRKNSNVSQL